MACAKKVFSYGVKKKSGSNGSAWADIVKEDTKKATKLPFKKGVWAKVNGGKTFSSLPLKNTFDEFDPFALPDDNDEVLDKSLTIIQRDHKSPKKNTNSFKSRVSNDHQKKDEKFENKHLSNSKKNDAQSPKSPKSPKSFYGSGKALFGKPLPQKSVTISSDDLKQFGSPKKNGSPTTEKNGQNIFKPLKLTPVKASVSKSNTPKTTSSGLIALKCTPVISSKSKAKAIPAKLTPSKSSANSTPSKNTPKNTSSKVKTMKGASIKSALKSSTSKTLKVTSKGTPKSVPKTTPIANATRTKRAKASKTKPKEVKAKAIRANTGKSAPARATSKSTPVRATSKYTPARGGSKRIAAKNNSPNSNAAKLKAAKSSLAKAKAGGRTPKLATPKVTRGGVRKAKIIKNGSASVVKKYVKLSQKINKTTPKKQTSKTVKKSPEKKRKVTSPIKTPKKNLKGSLDEESMDGSPSVRQRKLNSNDSVHSSPVLQTKSPRKQNSNKSSVAVQFVDDNSVVAIQSKDAKDVLQEDIELDSSLTEVNAQQSNEVKNKKSLFSYYNRMNSQIETTENGDIKDFDFDADNDDVDEVEKSNVLEVTEINKKSSFSLKRSFSEEIESSTAIAKKTRSDEGLSRSNTFDSNDKDDLDSECSSSVKDQKKVC